jgi:hypothetical protein
MKCHAGSQYTVKQRDGEFLNQTPTPNKLVAIKMKMATAMPMVRNNARCNRCVSMMLIIRQANQVKGCITFHFFW